jgi:hypothetical protein
MVKRITLAVLAALTVTLFCLESIAIPPASSEPGWEKIKDADGVVAYARNVPGSSVLAFKGEGLVDAPPVTVAWAFLDTERAPEWIADLVSSSVVRWLSPNQYIEYNHLHTPFVMKDRDFVSTVTLTMDRATRQFTIAYGATQDDVGAPRTDFVRGEIKNSRFVLTPVDGGRRTHLVAEVHCDPMGSVPKWIVNFFQRSWPIDTFYGLRRQVAKSDLKEPPPHIKALFE